MSLRTALALLVATSGVVSALPHPRMLEVNARTFSLESYDFVVVGGGTSGLIAAARLAENRRVKVGVIEAGPFRPDDVNINVPQGNGFLGNPEYDWLLQTVPQPGANGRELPMYRGKLVGGSSAINAMVWQRGARQDYDAWSGVIGNDPSWSFDGLVPYFKKTENWTEPTLMFPGQEVTDEFRQEHGSGGPIQVSYANFMTDLDIPTVVTAENLGLGLSSNPDGGNVTGFPLLARNVDPIEGVRSYTATEYITPRGQPNLHLLTDAQVTKINFKKSRGKIIASGVDFLAGNRKYSIKVKKELILAAGSLKTPQLLEVSGVGNATLLKSLGIKSVLDLPQVGENLQDHPVCITDFQVRDGFLTLDQLRFNSTFTTEQTEQYETNRTGALTYTPSIYGMVPLQRIVNETRMDELLAELDADIAAATLTPLQKVQYEAAKNIILAGEVGTVGFTVVPVGNIAAPAAPNASYVSVVAVAMHPFSRGSVHITSTDPTASPAIDVGYLSFNFDTHLMMEGVKFNRRWTETAPLSDLIESPHSPPPEVESDEDVIQYLRNSVLSHNHPLGSTVMAPKKLGGVVDSRLKVYGLQNVRVVDAGVIPMMVTAAIAPTVFAVAEKAADIIKEDWGMLY